MTRDDFGENKTSEVVDDGRWRHVLDRHPEMKEMRDDVNEAIRAPDEAFLDAQGAVHLVRKLRGGPSDFLVVVVRRGESQVRLITAYCTNQKRKQRRYRKFKKLALS